MTKWTSAQSEAINAPIGEGNILVSAAAGSGKTAVLVERINSKIISGQTDIDRLLVVTFTEAAAVEMKEKIIDRIQKAINETEDKAIAGLLQKQLKLASGADITTIDSFCLRAVKNNFHVLGLDPNFIIGDPAEAELMMDDTAEELFDKFYAENNERFLRLIDLYASNRDDLPLKKLVFHIYNFIMSFAEPIEWLDEKSAMYCDDMARSEWAKTYVIKGKCRAIGEYYKARFERLIEDMKSEAGIQDGEGFDDEMTEYWGKLWESMKLCVDAMDKIANIGSWDEAYECYLNYTKSTGSIESLIPSKMPKTKLADDDVWKHFCEEKNIIKKAMMKEYNKYTYRSAEDFNECSHCREIKETLDDIIWLVKEFHTSYMAKKDSKNIKQFHDIEHLAYRLFKENDNIREEYRSRYDEILIDEYQDTNGLQDAIFESISRDKTNMFMVGDLKQSIYRFRGGDPMIFKKKNKSYGCGIGGRSIVLSQNFRSRREILDGVNDVFESVMSDTVGDVIYKGDELITRDDERECYPEPAENNKCQMHCIAIMGAEEDGDEPDLPNGGGALSDKVEAAYIASKINEMVTNGYQIYDKEKNCYRNIKYRDITILKRSTNYNSDPYITAMQKYGIPSFVELEDYFERREISLVLSVVSVINNRLQDIELIAVMRSPIGGFTDNDIAKIRLNSPRSEYFYYAVREYAGDGGEEILRIKCERFMRDIDRWRNCAKQKSVAGLIWTIYTETGIYDFMGALEGGEEAQANLKLLYERAKQYEQSGFKGLFNFLRYIDKLRGRRSDLSGAKLIGENHDVVRIMTIHKSKGLEFPVVFLAGMGKRLRGSQNKESRVLLHNELGFGMKYADAEHSYYQSTMMSDFVQDENSREELSEFLRLLYVGMTRAKEQLIVISAHKFTDDESRDRACDLWVNKLDANGIMYPENSEDVSCCADWIAPTALRSDNWEFINVDLSELAKNIEQSEETDKEDIEPSEELVESVSKILEFSYKYPKSGAVPSKTSVSALKQTENDEQYEGKPNEYDMIILSEKPAFMQDKIPNNEIGTAHHQLMAYIDLEGFKAAENKLEFIKGEIERLIEEGQIDKNAVTDNMAEHCLEFFESDLAERMMKSDKIHREAPFEIEIPAKLADTSLDENYDGETVILQGVIDCFFEENGGVVLIDYKTDRVSSVEAIIEKYRMQLDLYAEAIEKITKKTVKEKYLYLFSIKSVVKLEEK